MADERVMALQAVASLEGIRNSNDKFIDHHPAIRKHIGDAINHAKEMVDVVGNPVPEKVKAYHKDMHEAIDRLKTVKQGPKVKNTAEFDKLISSLENVENLINYSPGLRDPNPSFHPVASAPRGMANAPHTPEELKKEAIRVIDDLTKTEGFPKAFVELPYILNENLKKHLVAAEAAAEAMVDASGKPVAPQVAAFHNELHGALSQVSHSTISGLEGVAVIRKELNGLHQEAVNIPGMGDVTAQQTPMPSKKAPAPKGPRRRGGK